MVCLTRADLIRCVAVAAILLTALLPQAEAQQKTRIAFNDDAQMLMETQATGAMALG